MKKLLIIGLMLLSNFAYATTDNEGAVSLTGYEFYEACKDQNISIVAGSRCITYLSGWYGGYFMRQQADELLAKDQNLSYTPNKYICLPSSVVHGQLLKAILKWLEDNPKHRNLEIHLLFFLALVESFPCE